MPKKDLGGAFSWLDTPTAAQSQPRRRRVRAKVGKRSDPGYVMAGAYVERGVRERVDAALTNLRKPGEKKPEYSDLVQSLLIRWLEEVEGKK